MDITVTVEFIAETKQYIKQLVQQLQHVHDVRIDVAEPRDLDAPTLVGIGIIKGGERGVEAAHKVAQVLYHFLHEVPHIEAQQEIALVTIEGERTNIAPLSIDDIERIIVLAQIGG
jgi:hypothetical protein